MYYGHTDIVPQTFQNMSVSDIMALEGNTPRTITGDKNNTFTIHHPHHLHYLYYLIDTMYLPLLN